MASDAMRRSADAEHVRRLDMARLARAADHVCSLILIEEYPRIDIEIERSNLRQLALELFPDRESLYDMVYESRFDRLVEQFRSGVTEPGF